MTVQYCHSITASGGSCPSGATQFCKATPILATSSADANLACVACQGSTCLGGICNGVAYASAGSAITNFTLFVYATPSACISPAPAPGDIVLLNGTVLGRWAN